MVVFGIGTSMTLTWEVRRLRQKQMHEIDVFPSAIARTATIFLMIFSMITMQAWLGRLGYPYVGIMVGALPFFWSNPKLRIFIVRRLRPKNETDY